MSKSPQEALGQLLAQVQTLQLATLDASAEPALQHIGPGAGFERLMP